MDRNLLKYYVYNRGDTMNQLADYLGIHYNSLNLKLLGKRDFTQGEIQKIATRYNLTSEEVMKIFF